MYVQKNACAKNYENWLAVDKGIATIKGCPFMAHSVHKAIQHDYITRVSNNPGQGGQPNTAEMCRRSLSYWPYLLPTPLLFHPNFGGVPVAPDHPRWASASA